MSEPFRARPSQVWMLLKHTVKEFLRDRATKQAAALAYYALFAIGPVLLLAMAVAGLFFSEQAVRGAVTGELGRLLGPEGEQAVLSLMEGADRDGGGVWGLVLGGTALLVGAVAVFHQLKESLNRVWEVQREPREGIKAKAKLIFRDYLLGTAGVLGTGFLLLVSLALSAGIGAASARAAGILPFSTFTVQLLHFGATLLMATILFALLYRYLPDVHIRWRDVWIGATITALLFVLGEVLIGLYIGQTATASRYGAAGAVLVVLLWVYYSTLILFFGAEMTQVFANRHGGHIHVDERYADTRTSAVLQRQRHPSREGTGEATGARKCS